MKLLLTVAILFVAMCCIMVSALHIIVYCS
jgi:hypothetical protein